MDELKNARDRVAQKLVDIDAKHRRATREQSQFQIAAADRLRHVEQRLAALKPRVGHDDDALESYEALADERVKLQRLVALR